MLFKFSHQWELSREPGRWSRKSQTDKTNSNRKGLSFVYRASQIHPPLFLKLPVLCLSEHSVSVFRIKFTVWKVLTSTKACHNLTRYLSWPHPLSLSPAVTLLQTYWLPRCFPNISGTYLTEGPHWAVLSVWNTLFPDVRRSNSLTSFKFLFTCYLSRRPTLTTLSKTALGGGYSSSARAQA